MPEFLIGIDGGGTSCRAAVATADGTVIGTAQAGPANILTDLDGALANIVCASRAAFANAGLDAEDHSTASTLLGLAGSNVEGVTERLTARLPFRRSEVVSDGEIALVRLAMTTAPSRSSAPAPPIFVVTPEGFARSAVGVSSSPITAAARAWAMRCYRNACWSATASGRAPI